MMKFNKMKLFIIPMIILLGMTGMLNITHAQTWKFAVISDTHDNDKTHTTTGVTPYLAPIINDIVEEKPDMVMETGDLIVGALTEPTSPVYKKYAVQYAAFQKAVEPLKNANVPLFVIRGNHDYGAANEEADLQKVYLEKFANRMPQNGPADAKGLSYSFVHNKVKFIMVDQYVHATNKDATLPMDWLKTELENKQGVDHIFVMGHSPAYSPTNEKKRHFNLYDQPALRDQFWDLLVKNNVTAYISGHKHVYFRGNVKGVEQIGAGNLGSALSYNPETADKNLTNLFPTTSVSREDNRPGYIIFTVDSDKNTITANEYCLDTDNNKYLYDTYQFTF
ncbi:putative phosphodiesterase [Sporomusaceae bacterium BoRhaA]|uniref:metallophosphoesterase family protein n=1 Tax=Pelorhabdus rhamnosifermentans TaxID=2772457 RepID=UPI001C060087|nr:metallophosphoesterase [Pelorhabdus rhamnosifermentans]MBU2703550.1 putative phosphodiesterase [Pelorhabdus rhamnosifermentans]